MATRAAPATEDAASLSAVEGEVLLGYDVRTRRLRAIPPGQTTSAGHERTVAAESSGQVVQELSSALEVADRLADVSVRLRANLRQVLEALDALAFATPAQADEPAASLSAHDEAVLREAGSLGYKMPPLARRASAHTALRTVRLLEGALSVEEAAERLHVSKGRVRQRLTQRTLLGIDVSGNWKLPAFQFTADGELRGIDRVLPALPSDVHPLIVFNFLTSSHPDLLLGSEPASPETWLTTGGSVEDVVAVAADLHSLP